jgi:hypothetical protein
MSSVNSVTEAMRYTEDEIAAYAFDMEPEEYRGETDGDLDPEDLAADVEGWDGEPLTQDEIAATNLYGTGQNNFDRPLELEREQVWEERHQEDQRNIAALQQHVGQQALREDPQRQQQQQEQMQQLELHTMSNPREALQYMASLQQQNQMLREQHGNERMEAAQAKYGDDFMDHYNTLKQGVDRGDQLYLYIRNYVLSHPDPGEALMQAMSPGHHTPRSADSVPSLNSVEGGYRNTPRGNRHTDFDSMSDKAIGYGSEVEEQAVEGSVGVNHASQETEVAHLGR